VVEVVGGTVVVSAGVVVLQIENRLNLSTFFISAYQL
jgi:hypothetical protein